MKRRSGFGGFWLVLLGASACTSPPSLAHDEAVLLSSVPTGASFTTDSGEKGTTPALVHKKRGKVLLVQCSLEGYAPQQLAVESQENSSLRGLLLLGGPYTMLAPPEAKAVSPEDGCVQVDLERVQSEPLPTETR